MIDFIVLVDLNNDKELSDAYQHCLNGNQLVNRIKGFCKQRINYFFLSIDECIQICTSL